MAMSEGAASFTPVKPNASGEIGPIAGASLEYARSEVFKGFLRQNANCQIQTAGGAHYGLPQAGKVVEALIAKVNPKDFRTDRLPSVQQTKAAQGKNLGLLEGDVGGQLKALMTLAQQAAINEGGISTSTRVAKPQFSRVSLGDKTLHQAVADNAERFSSKKELNGDRGGH